MDEDRYKPPGSELPSGALEGQRTGGQRQPLSEARVKTHRLPIFAKLGGDDRTAAVTAAMERGVVRLAK